MARISGDDGNNVLNGTEEEDVINGFAGNDTIDSVDRPANIFAGSVNPKRDFVNAGSGDDFVTGGKLDYLNGGSGSDFLQVNFNFNGPVAGSAPPITLTLDNRGTGTASDGTFITGFESVNFNLSDSGDNAVNTGNVRAQITGGNGNDTLTTGSSDDVVFGGGGANIISTGAGDDTISGGSGNDSVFGGDGDDTFGVNVYTDGSDLVNLGAGNDTVRFDRFDGGSGNIRLTFTSAEVGNGNASDANTMLNQDGGLAVRVQAEDASGNLTGPISRYDDEGTTFLAGTQGITFDVRDLVSGAARGDTFEGVVLGTSGADALTFFPPFRGGQNFYYNAGMGDDVVAAGEGNDFLVGGGGNDQLSGNGGNDSFIGGGGSDSIFGGTGNDTVIANVSTDGADTVNLGDGSDVVTVNSATPGQVRLTFTSGQVGNGNPSDSNTMANQDGGLAVRLQAEDGSGNLSGPISRYDDEGITFTAGAGVTFDVRDLVSGAERGDQFEVVTLGTSANDTLTAVQGDRSYYFNAGMGDDIVTGGTANDFLVGGAGNDTLSGGLGSDIFIGGGGSDALIGGAGRDTASYATSLSSVSADLLTPSVNQGDAAGDTYDSIENVLGSAFNDQLRGDDRNNVLDGGAGNDRLYGRLGEDKLNGGAGDDFLAGGNGVDFLNGGEGNDELFGGRGADTLTGGTGNDTFVYRALDEGSDLIRGFNVLDDTISLNASGFGVQDPASVTFISGPAAMATGSSMTLVYDTATSSLSFDSNGADEGGVSQIATFNSNPQLGQADILWV